MPAHISRTRKQPGQQHAGGLERGLPEPRGDTRPPGPLGLLRVVAAEGLLAADAAQDAQAGDDVGGHGGQLGAARSFDPLPSVQRPEQGQRSADEHRRREQHEHAQRQRGVEHDRRHDEVGDQLRRGPRRDLGERPELVGVAGRHAEHLAGRRPPREDVTHLHRLAGDHLHGAVQRDQPAAHDQGVHRDAERDPDHGHQGEQARPSSQGRGRVAEDALVDRLADQPRTDRQRQLPQDPDAGRCRDDPRLLAEVPAQERPRAAGVG